MFFFSFIRKGKECKVRKVGSLILAYLQVLYTPFRFLTLFVKISSSFFGSSNLLFLQIFCFFSSISLKLLG